LFAFSAVAGSKLFQVFLLLLSSQPLAAHGVPTVAGIPATAGFSAVASFITVRIISIEYIIEGGSHRQPGERGERETRRESYRGWI
jgi:hypothetical protein